MKQLATLLLIGTWIASCSQHSSSTAMPAVSGSWQLVASTSTVKDTTTSTFDPKFTMIKIINGSHFAFLNHSTDSKDTSAGAFAAGGGTFTLKDSLYTEHLDYYIDRRWENHAFQFTVRITNDTLVQRGVEKMEQLGIDRIIVEKYKRIGD